MNRKGILLVLLVLLVVGKDSRAQVNQTKIKAADTLSGKPMEGPSLTEVVVYGKKPPVNFKLDRQVYKASAFGNATGGSGLDVLKNLPSISVNANGEISFRGSASFLVMVNGKPTQADPAAILSQIPASSIERIEQITNPSAAFDADGKSGIINIITKKSEQDGWVIQANGMIGASALKDYHDYRHTDPKRNSADLSLAYKKNKWDISTGINYLRNDIAGNREGDASTIIGNKVTSFPSYGERSFYRYNYGARLAILFEADKHNSFSAGFSISKKFQSRVADLLYHIQRETISGIPISNFDYFNQNTQDKEGVFSLANLDYTHAFSNDSKLIVSALFERADLSGNTFNNNLSYPSLKDTLQYTLNPFTNPFNAYRVKTDYTKKIGSGNFQSGIQFRYDEQKGDFTYLTKNAGSAIFVQDPQYSSNVKVFNHIYAGYLQYGGKKNRLNYSGGLRLEQTYRDLNFSQSGLNKQISFTNLFPSLQFRYQSADKTVLKMGYGRRIKRNNNFELNPYPEREHSETLEQGDPELMPELTGNYEIGVEQTLSNGTFFASLYYQDIKNPIQRVNKVFNDTILNRVFTNASSATQFGLEANLVLQVSKPWQMIIGGNIYQYHVFGTIFHGATAVDNSSMVYSINSTQSFGLPKNWSMQLSLNYLSRRATAQGEDGAFLTPHFTLKKTSSDKRWTWQFQWLNIDAGMLQSNRQRITTRGADFYTTTNYIYETDQLQFSLGFNLIRKNRKISLPVSEMGEKEF